jgi:hypothetical protein
MNSNRSIAVTTEKPGMSADRKAPAFGELPAGRPDDGTATPSGGTEPTGASVPGRSRAQWR